MRRPIVETITLTDATATRRSWTARLAWLPLAMLVVACVASWVTARGPVPHADAAVVGVTGSIPADMFLDATNCTATSVAIGDLVPDDPWKTAQDEGAQACSLDFGTTNHSLGTTLSMYEDPAAPAAGDAMKCVGPTCTGEALDDYSNIGGEPAASTEAFGAQLLSAGGVASALWTAEPAVYPVQDAASAACETTSLGTGTCAFTWGATAAPTTVPGSYQAQARMVVLAN